MDKFVIFVVAALSIFIVIGLLALPMGLLVMLLWNALIPALFAGAPVLSFWQSVGLFILCSILFKSHSSGK